jgi:ribonuclease III
MPVDLDALTGRLGYSFRDSSLLVRALTHSSWATEHPSGEAVLRDNEQLEFLGDAVLGFLVSAWLVKHYPAFPEGQLTRWKAHLVRSMHLYEVGQRLEFGGYLVLGRGEEVSGGRAKRALLANAVEAVIAALFLDGGLAAAEPFVIHHIIGSFDPFESAESLEVDHKTALQELALARKMPAPRYVTVNEAGPGHAKVFTVEIRVGKEWSAQAEGYSKKSAGQAAARMLIEKLKNIAE